MTRNEMAFELYKTIIEGRYANDGVSPLFERCAALAFDALDKFDAEAKRQAALRPADPPLPSGPPLGTRQFP